MKKNVLVIQWNRQIQGAYHLLPELCRNSLYDVSSIYDWGTEKKRQLGKTPKRKGNYK